MNEMTTGISDTRKIAVDFGTELTIIAVDKGSAAHYPGLTGFASQVFSLYPYGAAFMIPSLISYGENGTLLIGEEVVSSGRVQSPDTVRRMLHYIATGNPACIGVRGQDFISYPEAGAAFLHTLLAAFPPEFSGQMAEMIFVVPVEAGEQYLAWIRSIGTAAGAHTTRTVDTVTATILGYDLPIHPDRAYVLVDIREHSSTATVAVAGFREPVSYGVSSRVLGKDEDDTGTARIDAWIAGAVIRRLRLKESDPRIQNLYGELLLECGQARERLITVTDTVLRVHDPSSGFTINQPFTREHLDRVLSDHHFLPLLHRTIDRAIAAATGRGHRISDNTAVLLTGSFAGIPGLQEEIARRFGKEQVYGSHAADARLRGALAVPSAPETITNDYAVRYWDSGAREHRYRLLVRAGTRYPSAGQVGRFLISASYDGQTHLGVPLYSLGTLAGETGSAIELVADETGGARIAGQSAAPFREGKPVWVNEKTPTLLVASPPAARGEPRFEVTFTIDHNRRLCLTARDLMTGATVRKDDPVFQLN